MLRRADNVQLFYKRDLWGLIIGRRYHVLLQIGRKEHIQPGRMPVAAFRAEIARSASEPVAFGRIGDRVYWRLRDKWFWDNDGLTSADVLALITSRDLRRDDTLSRAHSLAAMKQRPVPSRRQAVSPDIRQLVWHRDGGQCRTCGSNTELQFDHVIPIAMGGSSTEDNLQILCGPCNRRKGASVT